MVAITHFCKDRVLTMGNPFSNFLLERYKTAREFGTNFDATSKREISTIVTIIKRLTDPRKLTNKPKPLNVGESSSLPPVTCVRSSVRELRVASPPEPLTPFHVAVLAFKLV